MTTANLQPDSEVGAEDIARMLYIDDEWSGCNGSRWDVMPGWFQRERISNARDFLVALHANGYQIVSVRLKDRTP